MTPNEPTLPASPCPLVEFCVRAHGCKQYGDQVGHALVQESHRAQFQSLEPTPAVVDGAAVTLLRSHECFGHCDDEAAAIVTVGEHQALLTFFTIEEFKTALKKVLCFTNEDWEKRRPLTEEEIEAKIKKWKDEARAEFDEYLGKKPENTVG